MKNLFFAGLLFGAICAHAQSRTFPITVQCSTPGPQFDGTLTVPDQLEGKCQIADDKKSSYKYYSKSQFTLEFNNLTYVATNLALHFKTTGCDSQSLIGARYLYDYALAYETHSNFHVSF